MPCSFSYVIVIKSVKNIVKCILFGIACMVYTKLKFNTLQIKPSPKQRMNETDSGQFERYGVISL